MAYKCYKGSTLIKNIYAGSTKVKKVYKGSTLVWQADPYEPGTVLYESSTGGASTTLSLEEGLYQVICIAAGGGGSGDYRSLWARALSAGGGSGSGFNCILNLPKGNYAVSVGSGGSSVGTGNTGGTGGNSRFGSSYSYGGKGGYVNVASDDRTAGSGGALPTITYTRTSTTLNSAGNAGKTKRGEYDATGAGGSAVYGSYGKGGQVAAHKDSTTTRTNGSAGYVKVVYIGQA